MKDRDHLKKLKELKKAKKQREHRARMVQELDDERSEFEKVTNARDPLEKKLEDMQHFLDTYRALDLDSISQEDATDLKTEIDAVLAERANFFEKLSRLEKMYAKEQSAKSHEPELDAIRELAPHLKKFYDEFVTLDDADKLKVLEEELAGFVLPPKAEMPWLYAYLAKFKRDLEEKRDAILDQLAPVRREIIDWKRIDEMVSLSDDLTEQVLQLFDELPDWNKIDEMVSLSDELTQQALRLFDELPACKGKANKVDRLLAMKKMIARETLLNDNLKLLVKYLDFYESQKQTPQVIADCKRLRRGIDYTHCATVVITNDLMQVKRGIMMSVPLLTKGVQDLLDKDSMMDRTKRTFDYGANLERILMNRQDQEILAVFSHLDLAQLFTLREHYLFHPRLLELLDQVPLEQDRKAADLLEKHAKVSKYADAALHQPGLFHKMESKEKKPQPAVAKKKAAAEPKAADTNGTAEFKKKT